MMVLSYALAKRSGTDFETLLRGRLLQQLGISDTYITKRPTNVSPRVTFPTPCQRGRGMSVPIWRVPAACARHCPIWCADSTYTVVWFQLGAVLEAERIGRAAPSEVK